MLLKMLSTDRSAVQETQPQAQDRSEQKIHPKSQLTCGEFGKEWRKGVQ